MRIDLSDKIVLVTGAGSGIGAACARSAGESGAFVWVNDLRFETAHRTAAELGRAQTLPGDVAEPGDWLDPVDRLDAIVHCAGYDLYTPVGQADMAEFDRLHQVMVRGPFDLTQRLLPKMNAGGCVLFIASVHALATEPGTSAYAAAKGAQISMIRSMAQDLGPAKIRVVAVSPGYVDTPLLGKWIESTPDPAATRAHAENLHPLGRIGRPEDVASLVTFLISPMAEFINGTNVVIDGGLTAQLYR